VVNGTELTTGAWRLLDIGKDLSSRDHARVLRETGDATARLTFDFAGVRTLSDSFADELLAVLVEARGEDWFREHVKLKNLSADHRRIVLRVVKERLKRKHAARPHVA
jgi:STAS-like domain of unknown function (DUF4325)